MNAGLKTYLARDGYVTFLAYLHSTTVYPSHEKKRLLPNDHREPSVPKYDLNVPINIRCFQIMSNISRDKLNKIGILRTEVTTIEEHSQCGDLGIEHCLQNKHGSLETN